MSEHSWKQLPNGSNWAKIDDNKYAKVADSNVTDYYFADIKPQELRTFFKVPSGNKIEYRIIVFFNDTKQEVCTITGPDSNDRIRLKFGDELKNYLKAAGDIRFKKSLLFEYIGENETNINTYRISIIDTKPGIAQKLEQQYTNKLNNNPQITKESAESMELIENNTEKNITHTHSKYSSNTATLPEKYSRNIILYGPPGTGKTYNTINYAVAIIENTPIEEIQNESFADVKERYEDYKSRKLVDFVTFHQSYGYEDFIEGIKPVLSKTGQITYKIEPGVFKIFCKYATPEEVPDMPSEFNIWKVSLKNSKNPKFWDECIKNGCIRIGFEENPPSNKGGEQILSAFKTKIQIGDYVIAMNSQQQNIAVGRVSGEYEFHDEFKDFKHYRRVNWLGFYDKKDFVSTINNGTGFTLSTVYSLNKIREKLPQLLNNLFNDGATIASQSANDTTVVSDKMDKFQEDAAKPHVFIIDEINRGNVSKIFGELITSIEETKRIGEDEELLVTLPYSKEQFGVPGNVYLLGTMNTADRSLTRIDTALRRRFTFKELMPKSELLADIPDIDGINLKKMLDTMNERIEFLLSREHRIGHAYFLPLKTSHTLDTLKEIFMDKIIPLLQEYFYDDYLKIQLILGDTQDNANTNFIKRMELPDNLFKGSVSDVAEAIYVFNLDAFTNPESYRKIYNNADSHLHQRT